MPSNSLETEVGIPASRGTTASLVQLGSASSSPAHGTRRKLQGLALDLAILLLASLPALVPLFAPGYLSGHDSVDPPWRSLELSQALSQGVLWPRWVPDLFCGYGFPIFNFYSPLSFYPGAILAAFFGVGLPDATKVAFGLYLLLSEIGAYVLAREVVGNRWASLLAGVLYLYAPATVGTVYVRAALATSAGLAALPFALAALIRLLYRPSLTGSGVAAVAVAIFALAHNITVPIGFGIIGVVLALHYWSNRRIRSLRFVALSLLLGVGMASFFWIPALQEVGFTYTEDFTTGYADFRYHLVDPVGDIHPQLYEWSGKDPILVTGWGPIDLHPIYPYGAPPYKLGLLQAVLWLFSVAVLVLGKKRPITVVALSLAALLLFFLHTTWSRWLWELSPIFAIIQFPWRLIAPMGLCLAVMASWALLQLLRRRSGWLLVPAVGAASVLTSILALPLDMKPFEGGINVTPAGLLKWEGANRNRLGTQAGAQFLPRSVDWDRAATGLASVVDRYGQTFPSEQYVAGTASLPLGSGAWIHAARRGTQWMEALVEAAEPVKLAFHTVYFPGWTAYLDGNRVPIEYSTWYEYEEGRRAALGVSLVEVPAGNHLVRLVFEDTPVRTWSNSLSVLSALAVGILFLMAYCRSRASMRGHKPLVALILAWLSLAAAVYVAYLGLAASRMSDWVEHRVVADILSEVTSGRLSVSAPEGQKPEAYVTSKTFSIQGDPRSVLYMHPSASASISVWLPESARLEFAAGLDPAVWDKAGDGVEFEVKVDNGANQLSLFKQFVDPKNRPSDRRWIEASVDLSAFAHQKVNVVFSTRPGATDEYDWAGWANARIAIDREFR